MVLALFYVVAIRARLTFITQAAKSVHYQRPKIKQFSQSRKYIYFWHLNKQILEKESIIYHKSDIGGEEKG